MEKIIPAIVTLAFVSVVCAPEAANAQVVKVGSFVKSTAAAPVSQAVPHGLGITPKAIIFWTSGTAATGISTADHRFSLGFTDGTTSKSASSAAQHNQATTSTRKRMASVPLTIAQYGVAVPWAEAAFTSWDATNVTLNWTTNSATASVIHFIAIGGSGVSAKVLQWSTITTTGSQAVTGVGFQPSLVFHAQTNGNNILPFQVGNLSLGLGVMDAGGHQWAFSLSSPDGAKPPNTARGQRTDAAIHAVDGSAMGPDDQATFTSMDADGFTLNWTRKVFVTADVVVSLALTGLNLRAGSFNKNATAGTNITQSVTGVGFRPALVLLASYQNVTMPSTTGVANARVGLGAADGTTQGACAIADANGTAKSVVYSREETANVFVKIDNATAPPPADAIATLSTFDADGFTLNWGTNDAVATEMLYLALGSLGATSVTLASFTARLLPDGKTRLEWRTGYEVDNAGFRLYREQNGKRVRITSSIVSGSALMGARRGMSAGGRTYTWSEAIGAPPDAGLVQYWLEDVDIKGKSTWHGPIVPVATTTPREPR
jgi:hypothetical protein